jgi:hypothetical protein
VLPQPGEERRLQHIGTLTAYDGYWRLVYTRCGHVQEFARLELEDREDAAREVRDHYAECLTCRLTAHQARRAGPVPRA